ncbi:hypothetical protein BJ165DRAFT_947767 [Panaeolus papilionaceus]|nr:hypothetical protein BJ165DRAFT_947767 [Panaeolus papilionaceus]
MLHLLQQSVVTLSLLQLAFGYIPALPTNSTKDAIAAGLNVTDISKLMLQWYSNGSYQEYVSYQLVGNGSTGLSKGALVHFSEEKVNSTTPPTSTPWIALVSCDKNATDASMNEDIFTLARDKGAVSALLYSLYSAACVINPEYSDPATFDQVFDIFSTQSLTSAHLIEYQFGQLGPQNKSLHNFDSQQLNNSAADITRSIDLGYPVSGGYLLAALRAYNATDLSTDPTSTSGGTTPARAMAGSSPKTALAMIVLYAITGCVSALFCVVIVSGAIRAIRHPDRYGPRALDENGFSAQSRARGLTRAILDTFPIVKFSGSEGEPSSREKDLESQSHDSQGVQKASESEIIAASGSWSAEVLRAIPEQHRDLVIHSDYPQHTSILQGSSRHGILTSTTVAPLAQTSFAGTFSVHQENAAQDAQQHGDSIPLSFGRETCPICIVDFEEGDDLRVLPCEGKHRFHQGCVDPWLLKLSSSCPICRQDFLALETILSGAADDYSSDTDENEQTTQLQSRNNGRFSQYLRFAVRRHHDQHQNRPVTRHETRHSLGLQHTTADST